MKEQLSDSDFDEHKLNNDQSTEVAQQNNSATNALPNRARDVKADSKKSFQANLFGNIFFKHLQKAKSSLDEDKEKVSLSFP